MLIAKKLKTVLDGICKNHEPVMMTRKNSDKLVWPSLLKKEGKMIPMGTVVTVCMFGGLIAAILQPKLRKVPPLLFSLAGFIVLAAGLWNIFWYGLQHYTEFWGWAALISGVILIQTSLYVLQVGWVPAYSLRAKPFVLILLLGCALMYAIKIASL
jgi:hypothetical protein